MSTLKVDTITKADGTGSLTVPAETGTVVTTASSSLGRRNRIINGDMRIDQRNAGAAVTTNGSYPVDRFFVIEATDGAYSAQQSTTAPSGFRSSLYFTTTTADATLSSGQAAYIGQRIEGFNFNDLAWGSASAKAVTLSFKVRSSLTGTFGGAIANSARNRSYPFTYSISTANTWTDVSVTIPGDTSGTWLTDSGIGARLTFGLGVASDLSGTASAWAGADYRSASSAVSVIGTLNATFYITGVQLEVGSVATPFEHRSYGEELALCQRYFYDTRDLQQSTNGTNNYMELQGTRHAFADVVGYRGQTFTHPVVMRTNPTVTFYNPNNSMTSGQVQFYAADGSTQNFNAGLFVKKYAMYFWAYTGVTVGSTGQSVVCNVHWMADAEL